MYKTKFSPSWLSTRYWLLSNIKYTKQPIIDVGSGINSPASIWERITLDSSPDIHADINIPIEEAVISHFLFKFNTILCLDVIEHIENDAKALSIMAGILRPGGHIILQVPYDSSLFDDFDRKNGHYRRYDKPPEIPGCVVIHESCGRVTTTNFMRLSLRKRTLRVVYEKWLNLL